MLNLLDYRKNKYSALGNDGIIKFITDTIGIKQGLFVEFGAWDGIYTSNCRNLFKKGWDGIFIECDKNKYKKLKSNYKKYSNIICINKEIGITKNNKFDNMLSFCMTNKKIDFCSIDVDGLDVEIFETFDEYCPKIVCIESGFILPPMHKRVPLSVSIKTIQQSLRVTVNVFEKKGYKIICAGINCFFVQEEFYHLFNVSDDILTLYFNGLRAFSQYIPSIWKKLKKIDGFKKYRNDIAMDILNESKYDITKDSVRRRKEWARKKIKLIEKNISKIEIREKDKRYCFNNF